MNQVLDTVYDLSGSVPLPPQLKLARALIDTENQETARQASNTIQAIVLGVATLISYVIAIALLATSRQPRIQDGRWHGGLSVMIIAAVPLSILTGYMIYINQSCQKQETIENFANLSRLAQNF